MNRPGLSEYLMGLKLLAACGDASAVAELARWERLARTPSRRDDEAETPGWVAVLEDR